MARSLSPLRDDGPVTLADDTDLFYVSVQICVAGPGCLDYSANGRYRAEYHRLNTRSPVAPVVIANDWLSVLANTRSDSRRL